MTHRDVLVVYAHAAPHKSRVNRRLAKAAEAVPNVEVLDLYETYPDFYIDTAAEQARLARAQVIVFLHPIQWYSMPALLKEWVDTVLQHGWAYGHEARAMHGKTYWLVATTGSPAASYTAEGPHGHGFDDFLPPLRQTAALCGMHWEEPLILHGAHAVSDEAVDEHVAAFVARLARFASTPA